VAHSLLAEIFGPFGHEHDFTALGAVIRQTRVAGTGARARVHGAILPSAVQPPPPSGKDGIEIFAALKQPR
jgi:hypothetical protein